jgi:hypothetical protein
MHKALILENNKGENSKDKWMVGNIDADGKKCPRRGFTPS